MVGWNVIFDKMTQDICKLQSCHAMEKKKYIQCGGRIIYRERTRATPMRAQCNLIDTWGVCKSLFFFRVALRLQCCHDVCFSPKFTNESYYIPRCNRAGFRFHKSAIFDCDLFYGCAGWKVFALVVTVFVYIAFVHLASKKQFLWKPHVKSIRNWERSIYIICILHMQLWPIVTLHPHVRAISGCSCHGNGNHHSSSSAQAFVVFPFIECTKSRK